MNLWFFFSLGYFRAPSGTNKGGQVEGVARVVHTVIYVSALIYMNSSINIIKNKKK